MKWGAFISLLVGVVILIVGIVLGWYVFPELVISEVADNVILYNKTDQFERFEKLPIDINFKVYMFHVTNSDDVNHGEKPVVEEKGPYVYKQSRQKKDITWDDNNKISYYEYQEFKYDEKESGKLKDDDPITILNPALNAALQILEQSGIDFLLQKLGTTADIIFGADNIFLDTTVKDFLFDGIPICNYEAIKNAPIEKRVDAKLCCLLLYLMPARNLKVNNESGVGELIFSFLGHKNHNHDGHYTINSGIDKVQELAIIEKWEDSSYLQKWKGEKSHCNKVRGRDAVIFEPYLKDTSTLTVFNTDICRTVDLHYSKTKEYRDVSDALEFSLPEDTFAAINKSIENESCYCLQVSRGITQDSGCMKKGLHELFTCYNAPILLSFPHLLWADEEYQNAVEGLHPNVDKHRTFALLEPMTGTPLDGSKRVQFNMFVHKINGIKLFENFGDEHRLIPVLWLDESFEITDELYDILYDQYISKTYLIDAVKWSVIGIGIAVIVITIIVFVVLKKRQRKQTV